MKAVERGGKYTRKVKTKAGKWRYIYGTEGEKKEAGGKEISAEKVHNAIVEETIKYEYRTKSKLDEAEAAIKAGGKVEDPTEEFNDASSALDVANENLVKMERESRKVLNKFLTAKRITFSEGLRALQATKNKMKTLNKRSDTLERKLEQI